MAWLVNGLWKQFTGVVGDVAGFVAVVGVDNKGIFDNIVGVIS